MGFWTKKIIEKVFITNHTRQKYVVGQKVFFIADGKIKEVEIVKAVTYVTENGTYVQYELKESPYGRSMKVWPFQEEDLFDTKEELANSLIQ